MAIAHPVGIETGFLISTSGLDQKIWQKPGFLPQTGDRPPQGTETGFLISTSGLDQKIWQKPGFLPLTGDRLLCW